MLGEFFFSHSEPRYKVVVNLTHQTLSPWKITPVANEHVVASVLGTVSRFRKRAKYVGARNKLEVSEKS
jgi:hypothetical protein